MATFRNVSNKFIQCKTLNCLKNFLTNHKSDVTDSAIFNVIDETMSQDKSVYIIRSIFSKKEIEAFENMRFRRGRLDLEDNSGSQWASLWNIKKARRKTRDALIDFINFEIAKIENFSTKELFYKKWVELIETLKLSSLEADVLFVTLAVDCNLLTVVDSHSRNTSTYDKIIFIAKCLNCSITEVTNITKNSEKLRRYSLVDESLDFNDNLNSFLQGLEKEPLVNTYYQKQTCQVLPWDFYGKLAHEHGDILKDIIDKNHHNRGVNILLYGEPGTGKTSFAQTLAYELKLDCYLINQDSAHSYGSSTFRFSALQICANSVNTANSIIIVDEADEMLKIWYGRNRIDSSNKGLLNTVLDNINIPTIWISNNSASDLDESSRRRFDYAICFEKLSQEQRVMIWQNNISKFNLKSYFTQDIIQNLACKYASNAGGIALVLQNIANIKPPKTELMALLDKLMESHCNLLGIENENNSQMVAKDYSLAGLNIKGGIGLEKIVGAIRHFQSDSQSLDSPRMNILLSGVPGSGKTEFVKYLSSTLQTKLVAKSGSDLLSMYVGGSEKNIKEAFKQAENEKSILFLDEIDGLVQSREQAQRRWEVTQVNELLQQIENFNGIFIGATNFSPNLDSAILRRFTFKLEFDYLSNTGKKEFFERMFKTELTSQESEILDNISCLTPGDFRTVRQSLYYLNENITNNERLAALKQESIIKSKNKFAAKKIGF